MQETLLTIATPVILRLDRCRTLLVSISEHLQGVLTILSCYTLSNLIQSHSGVVIVNPQQDSATADDTVRIGIIVRVALLESLAILRADSEQLVA